MRNVCICGQALVLAVGVLYLFIYMEQNLPLASYRQMLGSVLENVVEAKIKEEAVEMDMKELCKNYYYL